METKIDTKKVDLIGLTEATLGVTVAICIDISILIWNGFTFDAKNVNMLLLDGFAFLVIGQLLGIFAARRIILDGFSSGALGIFTAWATLMLTTVAHCLFSDSVFGQRFLKDLGEICTVVFFFSFIPSGIHGVWFGYRIYKRGQKLQP